MAHLISCLLIDEHFDHSPICTLGKYTSLRYKSVGSSEAQIVREVCQDVQIEPTLFQITEKNFIPLTMQDWWIFLLEVSGITMSSDITDGGRGAN